MKRVNIFLLVFILSFSVIGNKSETKTPDIYFFQSNNISLTVRGAFFYLIYFDSGDILCIVSNKLKYKWMILQGKICVPTIYSEKKMIDLMEKRISVKENISVFDRILGLQFVLLVDKINYVLTSGCSIMFRMINGLFIINLLILETLDYFYQLYFILLII